jgi:F0F1-type ATP synthase membrane subunit b/b'
MTRISASTTLIAFILAPLPVLAAAGEHHGPTLDNLVYLIVFLLLVIPVGILLAPKVRNYLDARHDEVRTRIAEAEETFRQAAARLDVAEQRMARLEIEIREMMSEFRTQGEAERDALVREAEALSVKIRNDAEFRISQSVKIARKELADDVVKGAFQQVEERLAAKAGAPVREGIVDRIVGGMKRSDTGA